MLGTVERLFPDKGFGFIRDDAGEERFFHFSNVRGGGKTLTRGATVAFEPYREPKGKAANAVRQIVLPDAQKVFDEVCQWKLEAKLEDPDRYFYRTNDIQRVENGKKCFVIGRKGTGKTAICEYLTSHKAPTRFSRKLTFKNFPFRTLYDLSNNRYTAPNQYISLWKYLIYSSVAQLMADDHSVDANIRQSLAKLFHTDPVETLSANISRWTSRSFDFKVLGTGIGIGAAPPHREESWVERVDVLERLIQQHSVSSQYLVVFDELDEDYRQALDAVEGAQYKALITSLFKAVQDVKALFRYESPTVLPLLFLRDDIFSQIQDPDRTKWSDLILELEWGIDEIKQLLAFRISRALSPSAEPMAFDEAWAHLFEPHPITGASYARSSFSFVSRNSMRRPRDYVKCLQACADLAFTRGAARIDGEIIRFADKEYSTYLRNDLEDELGSSIPEISDIFALIADMGRSIFSTDEFTSKHAAWVDAKRIRSRDPREILTALHAASAIGTHARDDRHLFRYANRGLQPDFSRPFSVHRGLYKSLALI